jgi:hypothetical protein
MNDHGEFACGGLGGIGGPGGFAHISTRGDPQDVSWSMSGVNRKLKISIRKRFIQGKMVIQSLRDDWRVAVSLVSPEIIDQILF